MLDFLRKREREDVSIALPGVEIAFNHRLKIAFIYDTDTQMPNDRYEVLEAHLNKRGYVLQIIVAPAGLLIPPKD